MRRRLLLALLLCNACDATGALLPPGAVRFAAPAVYQQWWHLTEECSGLSGDLSDVTWFEVPGAADIPLGDGTSVNGRWDSAEKRIVLAGDSRFAGDLVRHEMLHALLRSGGHPRSAFIGRCSGVVVCIGPCIDDGGPAPPPDPAAQAVALTALEIGVAVAPASPGFGVDHGDFAMIVTARNTAPTPVIVQLPPSGDAGPSGSFTYNIVGQFLSQSYDLRADVPEATRFAAGEIKRLIFDLHIGTGGTRYDLKPGTYRFNGAYGDVWASNPPTVTVFP